MSDINVDLFYFINHSLQNPFFDGIMPTLTHFSGFIMIFGICVLVIILSSVFKKKNIRYIACLCLLSLLVADVIVLLLKHLVLEPRPFLTLDNVRLLVVEDDPLSFPSGHTASTFAVLSALIFKYRNKLLTVVLIVCAVIIGFSRIYVGVHYPLDVLAGALAGIFSAYFVHRYECEISDAFSNAFNRINP